jgi:long-subunit fatty acid transport protein
VDYGNDFVGRYQTSKATLAAVGISPSFAYKLNDRFSVGAGVSIIYTKFEQNIALNQGALVAGAPDGKVKIENATDWGYQPFLGMTYQLTDRALLGVVYRTKANVDLEGDVNFRNLVIATPAVNEVGISWDNPQWLEAGLRYRLSDRNQLFLYGRRSAAGEQLPGAAGRERGSIPGHRGRRQRGALY